jgi:hypothetical protein
MKASDTVIPAWKMAIKNRPITTQLIFHSDWGVQANLTMSSYRQVCTPVVNLETYLKLNP